MKTHYDNKTRKLFIGVMLAYYRLGAYCVDRCNKFKSKTCSCQAQLQAIGAAIFSRQTKHYSAKRIWSWFIEAENQRSFFEARRYLDKAVHKHYFRHRKQK